MGIIPQKVQDQLAFFNLHAPIWVTQAANIGLTAGQATQFSGKVTDAQDAWDNQQMQKSKALMATADMRAALSEAHGSCSALLAIIKGFAENSGDPQAVYSLAEIPAPAAPSPVAPPGAPFEAKVQLLAGGEIVLGWKCNNPTNAVGTIYEVRRSLGEPEGGTLIGATGVKSFTDDTIPAGTSRVYYDVTGVRSTSRGPTTTFLVKFGVGGPGISVVEAPQVKMAA